MELQQLHLRLGLYATQYSHSLEYGASATLIAFLARETGYKVR